MDEDTRELARQIDAFKSLLSAVENEEDDLLVVSDDYGAMRLFWSALSRESRSLPMAIAFADFAKEALSPLLLVSSVSVAVARALGEHEARPDGVPGWLFPPPESRQQAPWDGSRVGDSLYQSLNRFASAASARGLRRVLAVNGLASLKALKSYKGMADVFAIVAEALATFPGLRLIVLEYGLSPEAVFETTGKCLKRRPLRTMLLPKLSTDEVSGITSHILGIRPSGEEAELLCRLCDGRLSYLRLLCDALLASREGALLTRDNLISWLGQQLTDPLSGLSQLLRSRITDALANARGDTVLRHIMRVLAFEEGLPASRAADRIQRSVPATFDYLRWLMRSLVLVKSGAQYFFRDRLLRLWVRLDTLAEPTEEIPDAWLVRAVEDVLLGAGTVEPEQLWIAGEARKAPVETGRDEAEKTEAERNFEVRRPKGDDMLEFD